MVQEGRGHAAIDVWGYRRSCSQVGISRLRSGSEIALLRVQRVTPRRRSLAGSGGWHRQSPESCGATPPPGSGGLEYRATTAQWHAERAARRPKQAKLARNAALRTYVEERLAGVVVDPSGAPVPGPVVSWKSRRHGPRRSGDRRWANAWSPGADRPSSACGLPGRRDHAHQP